MKRAFYVDFLLSITDFCNQHCKHCYIHAPNDGRKLYSMNFDEMKQVVKKIAEFQDRYNLKRLLTVSGGDLFLNKDFWPLMDLLKKEQFSITLLCNPYSITENMCKRLKEYGYKNIKISIDGNEKSHDYIRQKGSYQSAINSIKIMKKEGMTVQTQTSVSHLNINDIPSLIDTLVSYKVKIISIGKVVTTCENNRNLITPLQYRNLFDTIYKKSLQYKDAETQILCNDKLYFLYQYEEGLLDIIKEYDNTNCIYSGCNVGWRAFHIAANGDIYPCFFYNKASGNIFKDELYDVMKYKYKEFRHYEKFEKCSKCELLRFCRGCRASVYAQTGNFYAPDPLCWKVI